MNENDNVLDIGCGGGETAFRASQLVGNAKVTYWVLIYPKRC